MARKQDLSIHRGDDVTYNITIKDSDGNAVDITGATIYFTVKDNYNVGDDEAKIQKTASITDASNGVCRVSLTHTDTDIDVGTYYYDLQVIDSSGKVYTAIYGEFRVLYDVTRKNS